MKIAIINIFRFILLIVIQVFFLKNLSIYGVSIPCLYVLFIILLPTNTPYIIVYASSFLLGLILDLFLNTLGIHSATCVATAFIRIILLNFIEYDEKHDKHISLTPYKKNLKGFLIFTIVLIISHGIILSILESANFRIFIATIKNSLYNILLTSAIIIIITYLFGINKLKSGK